MGLPKPSMTEKVYFSKRKGEQTVWGLGPQDFLNNDTW